MCCYPSGTVSMFFPTRNGARCDGMTWLIRTFHPQFWIVRLVRFAG